MRVAVSDYDGTLCIGNEVSERTLAGIDCWRKAGNAFGIATGRDLDLILAETQRWKIPYDFLICCDGATIYNHDLTRLDRRDIDDVMIRPDAKHSSPSHGKYYELRANGQTCLYLKDLGFRLPRLGVPFIESRYKDALQLRSLQQISLACERLSQAAECADGLAVTFSSSLAVAQNARCMDATPKDINKATGILNVLDAKGWPEKGLLVIGDNGNDISMIRRFNGFTVASGLDYLKEHAWGIYEDVGEMLLKHL